MHSVPAINRTTRATSAFLTSTRASKDSLWESLRGGRLQWLPELGIGWYPVEASPYDAAYWRSYRERDATEIGAQLTRERIALVARWHEGLVVDVGIGGGRFVQERPETVGFDINPCAVDWLGGRFVDPWRECVPAASFWDSLEHIHDPAPLLDNVRRWCFVSLPIFRGADHVLASKHYKRDEHCWYFTRAGFLAFMAQRGFSCVEHNMMEQDCGREDIESFAFRRM